MGVRPLTPRANQYFIRWLQCSSLVQWCTVEARCNARRTSMVAAGAAPFAR